MRYLDEYRDGTVAKAFARQIARVVTRPWTLMEVCGGQTHAIVRFGIDELLPKEVSLVHGPGCPVCVTPVEIIDLAQALAARPEVILCSFGDMLRVPGSKADLFAVKARGGDVRVLYSPMDALDVARANPRREVVFFAVGFETTAPTTAAVVRRAHLEGVGNFSLLMAHVRVPPAMRAVLSSPGNTVQGFLAAGHVCTVMGYDQDYVPLARQYGVPIVVTGFEPVDILQGVYMCVKQLEEGRAEVVNQYVRSVRRSGNTEARRLIREVFRVVPRRWRGLGEIAESGLGLAEQYAAFDAERRFGLYPQPAAEIGPCRAGEVLTGRLRPADCPSFGSACTPERPLGAPMVSSEGACAAYYQYRRAAVAEEV